MESESVDAFLVKQKRTSEEIDANMPAIYIIFLFSSGFLFTLGIVILVVAALLNIYLPSPAPSFLTPRKFSLELK